MFRLIGIFFVAFVISSLLLIADYFLPGNFLADFLGTEFIQTYAALVGFNFAAIIFLLGQIFSLDSSGGGKFSRTKAEIKENAHYMLFSFVFSIFLLTFRPLLVSEFDMLGNWLFYLINATILSLFIVSLIAIFEILDAAFLLSHK